MYSKSLGMCNHLSHGLTSFQVQSNEEA